MEMHLCLLLTGLLTMMTTTMRTVHGIHGRFDRRRPVSHAELEDKLREVKCWVQKLARYVGYHSYSGGVPYSYLQCQPPYQTGYPGHQGKGHPYYPPPKDSYRSYSSYCRGYGHHKSHGHGGPPHHHGIHFQCAGVPGKFNGFYYLAFLGKACVDKSIYDLYTCDGDNDTHPTCPNCGCLSLTDGYQNPACKGEHYKSHIITEWDHLLIDKVRVSVYKDGEEKVFFIFNGQGSTSLNFFSKERLLYSSYDDLHPDTGFNYFSIEGHIQRRFFISKAYGGYCTKDHGWHVVVDGPSDQDQCQWTTRDHYPVFLYANSSTYQTWHKGVGEGEIFVISVKLKGSYKPSYIDVKRCYPRPNPW